MFGRTADWYDLLYEGKDYAAEAADVRDVVLARCPHARSILDVGCGTGLHLAHLRDDFEVVGVDVSSEMIDRARERLPGVELHVADMRDFDLGRQFDAVVSLFSAVGYLLSRTELFRAVDRMARHLLPGAVLLIEGWVTPEDWEDGHVGAVAAAGAGRGAARLNTSRRDGEHSILDMHYLLNDGRDVRYLQEEHRLRLHSRDDYVEAFEASGLEDVTVDPDLLLGRGVYIGTMPR